MANNFDVDPRNRRKFPRPILPIVWPSNPGGVMRFPFGGETAAAGRARKSRHEQPCLQSKTKSNRYEGKNPKETKTRPFDRKQQFVPHELFDFGGVTATHGLDTCSEI